MIRYMAISFFITSFFKYVDYNDHPNLYSGLGILFSGRDVNFSYKLPCLIRLRYQTL